MYEGIKAPVKLGIGGLYTDDPHTIIPPNKLIQAKNITLLRGKIEKDFGSRRWNSEALPDKVIHFTDWHPNDYTQRMISVCANGKVYRHRHSHVYAEVTPTTSAPGVLNTKWYVTSTKGGAENTGGEKKLFIFTGNDPVQVISGDGTTRSSISKPASDWSGTNHPFKGIIHRGYLFAFGNRNAPHRVYRASSTDHEDFTTTPWSNNVYPGEGDMLMDARTFKGKLFLFKFPVGIYVLNDSDSSPANWFFEKFNESVGSCSPYSTWEVLNDLLVANEYGTVTSVLAIDRYGDIESADIFNNLRVDDAIRYEMSLLGGIERHTMYYPQKKLAYVTYNSLAGTNNDRFVQIKFGGQTPEVTIIDKDQPNCLALVKDSFDIERPFYGSNDGYIYEMDRVDRDVAGNAYTGLFETPYLDFGAYDQNIADKSKNFDHFELVYEPTGYFNLTVDYFIDGKYMDTFNIKLDGFSQEDVIKTGSGRTSAVCPLTYKQQIKGSGRRIKFRCYNSTLLENFKITGFNVYFKIQGERQTVRD